MREWRERNGARVRSDQASSLWGGHLHFHGPLSRSSAPRRVTTLEAIHHLNNEQASQRLSVSFQATVSYYRGFDNDLFVQDRDAAIYVDAKSGLKLVPGDRILVQGTTRASFRPYIEATNIALVGHGALPGPEHPAFEEMIRGETDCRRVTVQAVIRSADLVPDSRSPAPTAHLQMLVDGGLEMPTSTPTTNPRSIASLMPGSRSLARYLGSSTIRCSKPASCSISSRWMESKC